LERLRSFDATAQRYRTGFLNTGHTAVETYVNLPPQSTIFGSRDTIEELKKETAKLRAADIDEDRRFAA
jgi:hypothetical protein